MATRESRPRSPAEQPPRRPRAVSRTFVTAAAVVGLYVGSYVALRASGELVLKTSGGSQVHVTSLDHYAQMLGAGIEPSRRPVVARIVDSTWFTGAAFGETTWRMRLYAPLRGVEEWCRGESDSDE